MNNLFFSVVIPLYNKEKYIKRTLDSVLNQTFTDFEIVIVDDGSKDKSCKIVESISDSRIRLIRQENGGPSKARNHGIKEAKGQFIAFLDADDEWLAEKLEKQYELHNKNPDLIWSCSAYTIVGGRRERITSYKKEGVLSDAIDEIVDGLSIWTSTVVIKKYIFNNERFLFNESFMRSEDRELWYKIACIYPQIGYMKNILAQYNIDLDDSLTKTADENIDFSFLSLEPRIKDELNAIDNDRKEQLLHHLKNFNKKAILNFWVRTNTFKQYENDFERYINKSFLTTLNYWNFLPKVIKKLYLKYWIYTHSGKGKL